MTGAGRWCSPSVYAVNRWHSSSASLSRRLRFGLFVLFLVVVIYCAVHSYDVFDWDVWAENLACSEDVSVFSGEFICDMLCMSLDFFDASIRKYVLCVNAAVEYYFAAEAFGQRFWFHALGGCLYWVKDVYSGLYERWDDFGYASA